MKLYIFGSCSGTEPRPERHHTAMAFEINRRLYWFDAGENCSYTAHLMGVDLLSVTDIFISHPHMDHVGGLGNLLWNIRKLTTTTASPTRYGDVTVHVPVMETFDGIISVLRNTEGGYACSHKTIGKKITDGTLLKNDDIEVRAFHNLHMPANADGWQSFSFTIEAEGKRMIYSGDLKRLDDIKELLCEGCDLLLMETGHHKAEDVCKKILNEGYPVASICFVHHGVAILGDYDGTLERCQAIFPSVRLANDRDVIDV